MRYGDLEGREKMKRVLIFFLFLLPVIAGLFMPDLWFHWQDNTPQEAQSIDLSEPVLSFDANKSSRDNTEITELTGKELAHRLQLFESGPNISLPQTAGQFEDTTWVYDHALNFLNALFDAPPKVTGYIAQCRFAWFEEGFTIPIWTVEMVFNGDCQCILDIDRESGLILRSVIHSFGEPFEALFPEAFAPGDGEGGDYAFRAQVSQRFCDALEDIMSHYGDIAVSVWPTTEVGGVNISFTDDEITSITAPLLVYPGVGIWFNYPDPLEEESIEYLVP